ncbi:MAG: 2,3,4,5-tetrahydropyridine-2,6-dicarboxylate N-succinyltransferase [Chloroflexota bacterium]
MSGAALLGELEAGVRRAAAPDPAAPGGWRVDASVKEAILALFAVSEHVDWEVAGLLRFRDRAALPTRAALTDGVRVVPGGTSVRAGAHLAPGVVIMPPSYVNVGAWIGAETMIDSHVLVGSCAQIGARVHLAAGVQVGGVLEPPGARPVIVEEGAFVGAGACLLDGVLVGHEAVIGAGVVLTGTSRLYDLVEERVLAGSPAAPLSVPPGAVVVPGTRRLPGSFATRHGLGLATAIIVKRRDAGTAARVALEEALR